MDFYRPPANQETLNALGTVYRALRAWRFYPKGHPTRRSSLSLAHSAMLQLLDGNALSLSCGRTGFSFPDGEFLKDDSGLSTALAYELFIRRAQKIVFFHDIYQEDLLELLKVLSMPSDFFQQSGAIDTMIAARGIRSISVNEFDLAAIRGKRQNIEQSGIIPQGIEEAESDSEPLFVELQSAPSDEPLPEQQLQALLGRIIACQNEDDYLILIRQAVACADDLVSQQEPHLMFPLIELLTSHAVDTGRSESMRECAKFAIELIITRGDVIQILLGRIEQGDGVSETALQAVLKAGGAGAVSTALDFLGRTGSLKVRKTLSTLLGSLGEPAVPMLLALMHDSRWFIIRNICSILGAIASRESLPALIKCLQHPDLRVRKEALRSMSLIGGPEVENALLGILRGTDPEMLPQAIVLLGGMKSKKSLIELMNIVLSKELFLKSLPLKIVALAAIASIGNRQVTPHLVKLLEGRHLLAAARGEKLKAAVVGCLGKLGDVRAVPHLEKLAANNRELASTCADAIAMIEKRKED